VSSGSDSKTFSNISATTAQFTLLGGTYGVTAVATWGGRSVTLQVLAPDGTTWVTALTAFAANGYGSLSLPPGQYRLAVVTATAVYASVCRVNLSNRLQFRPPFRVQSRPPFAAAEAYPRDA
jgi:hypothetical protein